MHPLAASLALLLAPAIAAAAEPPGLIGDFGAWTAYSHTTALGQPHCYAASRPARSSGAYRLRGDAYLLVAHRPWNEVFGEVSVVAGYDFADNVRPRIAVGPEAFELAARGDTAWVRPEDQAKLVAAMQRGGYLTVVATSSRGTETTDVYALRGFDSALAAVDRACRRG